MADEDWSTLTGIREIARARAARIPGWQAPVAYALGYRSDDGWHFPHVNQPSGTHGLPAVILAEIVGHAAGTREFSVTPGQLDDAIAQLAPAEAATGVSHPNLVAWRAVAAAESHEIAVVFIGSVDDDSAGPADAALRGKLTGG
ncbi:hypothetical protein CIW52_13155 [Mycolicibacterium sp. P9-64]|uniref:hypothetical protein n=1 Tax=Mycolicibacterium sp. P9-64 TaxID=2024612 RepID=UPI0011EBE6D7|nr:hypothetical protein [Mycolicibacterium sp. P9-64]KAA0083362.1 hypothetical protein CIW52_13155 [Mycolicibacterium sp. P9-64]